MKLIDILKQILLEEKKKADRCKRIADRKYDKPSAYKSGSIVRCRKGDIWKDLKEDESLHKWFKRKGTPGKEGGTGLGLNICIAILNEHGFKITCEKNDIGTKMKIKLK